MCPEENFIVSKFKWTVQDITWEKLHELYIGQAVLFVYRNLDMKNMAVTKRDL